MNFTTFTRRAVLGAMSGALAFGALATAASAEIVRLRFHTFYGTVFLGKGYGHNYDPLTKETVTSLADLQTRKIRATSNVAKVLDHFGIPTVYLPAQELYIGMSTGV